MLTNLYAQNLVPNYSFENYSSCPVTFSQVSLAAPWFQTTTIGTSDFLNACNTDPNSVGVPENLFGSQPASTGSGYCGFGILIESGYHEYLSVPLTDPLVANACYYGEMYVSLGETYSTHAIDKIGMYITNGTPTENATGEIIASPEPQIYSNAIISDTDNWVQISGVFVADGGETHLTLGLFFPTSEVNTEETGGGLPGIEVAYYFADDISLVEVDEFTTLDYVICDGECVTIAGQSFCDEGTFEVTIPECTNGENSFTVNITTQSVEQIVIEPASEVDCNMMSTTLDASGTSGLGQASSYGWTGPNNFSSTQEIVDVSQAGWYTFAITSGAGCTVRDSVEVIVDVEAPELSIDPLGDWDCVSPGVTISGSSSTPGVIYQWEGPGTSASTSSVIVSQSGVYQLVITGTNGCTEEGSITIPDEYFTLPEATAISTGNLDCFNSEIDLFGTTNISSGTYLWSGPGVNEYLERAGCF